MAVRGTNDVIFHLSTAVVGGKGGQTSRTQNQREQEERRAALTHATGAAAQEKLVTALSAPHHVCHSAHELHARGPPPPEAEGARLPRLPRERERDREQHALEGGPTINRGEGLFCVPFLGLSRPSFLSFLYIDCFLCYSSEYTLRGAVLLYSSTPYHMYTEYASNLYILIAVLLPESRVGLHGYE